MMVGWGEKIFRDRSPGSTRPQFHLARAVIACGLFLSMSFLL